MPPLLLSDVAYALIDAGQEREKCSVCPTRYLCTLFASCVSQPTGAAHSRNELMVEEVRKFAQEIKAFHAQYLELSKETQGKQCSHAPFRCTPPSDASVLLPGRCIKRPTTRSVPLIQPSECFVCLCTAFSAARISLVSQILDKPLPRVFANGHNGAYADEPVRRIVSTDLTHKMPAPPSDEISPSIHRTILFA